MVTGFQRGCDFILHKVCSRALFISDMYAMKCVAGCRSDKVVQYQHGPIVVVFYVDNQLILCMCVCK